MVIINSMCKDVQVEFPELCLMFDHGFLYLFPSVGGQSPSDEIWARHQSMSLVEHH